MFNLLSPLTCCLEYLLIILISVTSLGLRTAQISSQNSPMYNTIPVCIFAGGDAACISRPHWVNQRILHAFCKVILIRHPPLSFLYLKIKTEAILSTVTMCQLVSQ